MSKSIGNVISPNEIIEGQLLPRVRIQVDLSLEPTDSN
jgi:valyl-tRNA synthetase